MPAETGQVLACIPMVHMAVREVAPRLPPHADLDGLTSAGLEALAWCAGRYDPARAVPFPGYARTRIKGALLDEMQRTDHRTGPRANRGESVLSLERLVEEDDSRAVALNDPQPGPEQHAVARDLLDRLRAALLGLPLRLRLVVHATFFTDTTHCEAAAAVGIPHGDFYLLRTEAIRVLRLALGVPAPAGERTVALPRRLAA